MLRSAIAVVLSSTVMTVSIAAQKPTVIKATNAPVWGVAPKLMPELRIGVLEGDEEYMFAGVVGVAVGKAGQIFVADGGEKPVVRAYSAAGKFQRNVGGFGEGPGEYRHLGAIRTFADGRLAVWDNRIQRFTTYSPEGKRLASARVPSGLFSSDLLHVTLNGEAFVQTVVRIDPISHAWYFGWIHVTSDLRVADTIAVPVTQPINSFVSPTPAGFDKPFRPEIISTMTSRGELLTGSNEKYAFELRRKGGIVVQIERPYTPLAVTAAEHAEWTALAEYVARIARADRQKKGRPLGAYVVPRSKPVFKDLIGDSDGRIWVRRYVPAVSHPGPEPKKGEARPRRVWREPAVFDVFEPTGRLLGTITLPWDAWFADAVGMNVYVVQTGPDGDESVQRLRIVPAK
ncbi:MAG: hypothetical protein H7Z40_22655 [Phycisphaerae bacterium]|nr:hypothetical protein [Gemmatimonadaceae bacterium]